MRTRMRSFILRATHNAPSQHTCGLHRRGTTLLGFGLMCIWPGGGVGTGSRETRSATAIDSSSATWERVVIQTVEAHRVKTLSVYEV